MIKFIIKRLLYKKHYQSGLKSCTSEISRTLLNMTDTANLNLQLKGLLLRKK